MYRTPPSSREPSPRREEDTDTISDSRASRRLEGLPPQYGPLPDKTRITTKKTTATMTAAVAPTTVVMHQPREPPTFRGSPCEDPESWLEAYDRVSTFNNWDCDEKLRHVYFALEHGVRTWFENRESKLTSWDLFRTGFLNTFTSVVGKERAQTLLETRVQLPNSPRTSDCTPKK